MFINVSTKEFTLTHLVTFSISCSRIRMKFMFMTELMAKYKIRTCHYMYSNYVI